MKGIDISSYNGDIDFTKVKASGIEIVYLKATEGITYNDPNLIVYYNKAKAAGLKVGFYHFLRANNPVSEAQRFLDVTKDLQADCLYMVDAELALGLTKEQLTLNIKQFADYLNANGKSVGLYTGDYFYRDSINNIAVKELPLWVANYSNKPLANSYVGWQYSETGKVNGIYGDVDLDEFYDGILISKPAPSKSDILKLQIEALQYWLNVDYNAKITADGVIRENELYPNLEAVGKLIVKGHKSHLVQWIQQKLIGWGYLKPGQDTSVYDEPTFQAVTNLQKAWNRETSGKILISNNTWQIFLYN